jgi:hypothetical protein
MFRVGGETAEAVEALPQTNNLAPRRTPSYIRGKRATPCTRGTKYLDNLAIHLGHSLGEKILILLVTS